MKRGNCIKRERGILAEYASIHAKYELQEAGETTLEKKKAKLFLEVAQGSEQFAFLLAIMKRLTSSWSNR